MFNQRTGPHYIKLRRLIQSGELGAVRRLNWIITNWFRPEIYYASGGWRATWAGERRGAPPNQCPHNLNLLQSAMLRSTWENAAIQLPLDGARWEAALQQRITGSTFKKKDVKISGGDMAASFNR